MPIPTAAPLRSAAKKARRLKAVGQIPGLMWWPGLPRRAKHSEMMSHIDCWRTRWRRWSGVKPPYDWVGNDGKGIYFDSIDNSAYILGKAKHSDQEFMDLH